MLLVLTSLIHLTWSLLELIYSNTGLLFWPYFTNYILSHLITFPITILICHLPMMFQRTLNFLNLFFKWTKILSSFPTLPWQHYIIKNSLTMISAYIFQLPHFFHKCFFKKFNFWICWSHFEGDSIPRMKGSFSWVVTWKESKGLVLLNQNPNYPADQNAQMNGYEKIKCMKSLGT